MQGHDLGPKGIGRKSRAINLGRKLGARNLLLREDGRRSGRVADAQVGVRLGAVVNVDLIARADAGRREQAHGDDAVRSPQVLSHVAARVQGYKGRVGALLFGRLVGETPQVALGRALALGLDVRLGRNLQRVRVSARLAAHEGALDDGDELPALEGPVLVEETELGQKGPARVREQRGPNSHPGTIAARPVSVGV